MAFRATGAGQIEIDPRYAGAGMLKALLYNFDFDDAHVTALKREHIDFLRTRALPLLAGDRGSIWLQGQASQVGNRAYNLDLSRRRVNRVLAFLTTNGVASGRIQPDAVGEDASTSSVADDPRDRSVAFVILQRERRDPPPPPRIPPPPAVTTHFRLRLLGDLGITRVRPRMGRVGAGPAAEGMLFEIQDLENGLSAFYGYSGMGAGVGLDVTPWLSGTGAGPWNNFGTSAPMNVGDFGGPARFTTAGGGNYTVNWINIIGTPEGVDSVYLQINTGTTYGLGATSTVGVFQRVAGPMRALAR